MYNWGVGTQCRVNVNRKPGWGKANQPRTWGSATGSNKVPNNQKACKGYVAVTGQMLSQTTSKGNRAA